MEKYNFQELAGKYFEPALNDLIELVKIPSVLDEFRPETNAPFGVDNVNVLNKFLELASNLGFETHNDDNYAGDACFGDGEEELGVLGHLDVVPAVGEWTYGPFNPTIADGKLFGRGTLDDKGGVVASLYAMKLLKDLGYKPSKKIKLIVGCDEESGSRCLMHYFKNNKKCEMAFSPDASFPVIYGEKGILDFDIIGNLDNNEVLSIDGGQRYNIVIGDARLTVKNAKEELLDKFLSENSDVKAELDGNTYVFYGKPAHASTPDEGDNAAYKMFRFMNEYYPSAISKFVVNYIDNAGKKACIDLHDEEMGDLTLNLGIVRTEGKHFRLGFNLRVPRDTQAEVVKTKMTKIACDLGLEMKDYFYAPSHYVDPNGFLVSNLQKAYQEETGDYDTKPFVIGGGTYAKALENAVAFGPCFPYRPDICHEPDEHIFLEDLVSWIAIYANAIYRLAK